MTIKAEDASHLKDSIKGGILNEVWNERHRQDGKWGEQNHPDGTGTEADKFLADFQINETDRKFDAGEGTWKDILAEEVLEAFAEEDPVALREELIQVAAVAAAWVEAIDRRAVEATL